MILFAAALMFLGGPAAAATSSQCTLAKIAEIPVRVVRNKLVVDGAINGKSGPAGTDPPEGPWRSHDRCRR